MGKKSFLVIFMFFFFSGNIFSQRLIPNNKIFIPSKEISSFSPMPNLRVYCVGGLCSKRFIEESSLFIATLISRTEDYFNSDTRSRFVVRVVSEEYFDKLAEKFPKKRSSFFLFLRKKETK